MEQIVSEIKAWGFIIMSIFAICGVVKTLLGLNPRVVKLEERMSDAESKISAIEFKLDTIIKQNSETRADVKQIYSHLVSKK